MRTSRAGLTALLASAALAGLPTPAMTQQPTARGDQSASELRARDEATNRAMLNGFLQRRIAIAQSEGDTKASRAAIAFLDERIAQLIKRSVQR